MDDSDLIVWQDENSYLQRDGDEFMLVANGKVVYLDRDGVRISTPEEAGTHEWCPICDRLVPRDQYNPDFGVCDPCIIKAGIEAASK
jgi:hypothetical protein